MTPALPSVNRLLAKLVLLCVLPATALFLLALAWSYESQRAEMTQDTIATARALMFGVDERLHSVELGLANLSQTRALAEGDFGALQERAATVAAMLPVGSITLVDAGGRKLMTTRSDAEVIDPRALPPGPRGPRVLDLFRTPLQQRYTVAVALPVRMNGEEGPMLIASVDPAALATILGRERLPANWIAAVLDGRGVIVARTSEHDRYVGTPARPALIARIREVPEDAVESVTVDNVPVVTAFSRSAATGWSVVIGVPLAAITAPLKRALGLFAAVSALVLVATLALSQRLAGRISGSLHALAAAARSVGGGPIDMSLPAFGEAAQLGQGLLHAEAAMRDAQEGRARAEALLDAVNEATGQAVVAVDENELIVLFNAQAQRLFRVAADDVLGLPLRRLLPRASGEPFPAGAGASGQPVLLRALTWTREPFVVEARACATANASPVTCTLVLREAEKVPAGA